MDPHDAASLHFLKVIAFSVGVVFLLFTLDKCANAESCPPGAASCKVITLTPDEQTALLGQNGILQTAEQGRFIDLSTATRYFRAKIEAAPAGTVVPAEPKPGEPPAPPPAAEPAK